MKIPKILPIWKKVGQSTHIIAKQIAEKYGVKTSHTGTLDPMAEGVIIILLGEDRHKKYEYAKWKKGYEFEILFGVKTDTYDGLGIITDIDETKIQNTRYGQHRSVEQNEIQEIKITEQKLRKVLQTFKGEYIQTVPPYSAIKIKGRPLHYYARNDLLNEVELPKRSGEIFDIELISLYEKTLDEIVEGIVQKIKLVQGDLRQDEIIKGWNEFMKGFDVKESHVKKDYQNWQIAKLYVETSKGLYVRTLAQDIAKKLDTYATVISLKRTKNGIYEKAESAHI